MTKENKRFNLTLTIYKKDRLQVGIYETIEANSLIELLSKFQLSLARFHQDQVEELDRHIAISNINDDDIPF